MAVVPSFLGAIGSSGLRGSRTGFLLDEPLPQLRGQVGAQVYKEMSLNDPVIGAMLYAVEAMVRKAVWRIEPVDQSGAALDAAQFADEVLFQDMSRPFSAVIDDALSMLVYGFAPMEIIWKRRNGYQPSLPLSPVGPGGQLPATPTPSSRFTDGRIGLDRLMLLSQETVWRWYFDQGGQWYGLEQITTERPSVNVPREKLLNFRTSGHQDSPESRSVLRSAYIPYTRKKTIEIAMGRLALRSAGIVVLRIPGMYMDENADEAQQAVRTRFEGYAQQIAQERVGSLVLPSNGWDEAGSHPQYDVEFVTADGRTTVDQTAIIGMYDRRIAMCVLADFLLVGQDGGGGNRAMLDSRTGFFGNSLAGYLRSIRDEINRVLMPRLWRLNGLPEATMPHLEHGDFEQRDLAELSQYVTALAAAGMPMFPDPALENVLRGEASLPPIALDQRLEDEEPIETAPVAPAAPSPAVPATPAVAA